MGCLALIKNISRKPEDSWLGAMGRRIVALVSGGKDSCYSMMQCVAHGHEVVAIANLHPPPDKGEELDSFMYQTVGHAHVGAIAEAMGLPLFRREILGTAVEQGLRYGATAGDEVEDLHALLSTVVAELPGVDAVCSGAILSNYQRARVESVCERLGLVSFAFLWQRNQGELLDEMVNAGIHAALVKVASYGLNETHLGKTVGELRPHFARLEERFGFHVCGEGGEYETFTLDCPLFKRRLQPVGQRVLSHGGGACLLSYERVELCEKRTEDLGGDLGADLAEGVEAAEAAKGVAGTEAADEADEVVVAEAVVEEEDVAVAITAEPTWTIGRPAAAVGDEGADRAALASPPPTTLTEVVDLGGGLIQAATYGRSETDGHGSTAQLGGALERLRTALQSCGLGFSDVLQLRLYVADMAEYATLNAAFSKALTGCVPAARVAVQLPLGGGGGEGGGDGGGGSDGVPGCRVAVECLSWRHQKELLHVQSISRWAPRMIGPYCQLTRGAGAGFVAGSLGLQPASMTLAEGGARAQARLALRNCEAVLGGLSIAPSGTLGLVVYITRAADATAVHAEALRWLCRVAHQRGAPPSSVPPVLLLQVGALPMGALVEVQLEACAPSALALHSCTWESRHQFGQDAECKVRCAAAVAPPMAAGASPPEHTIGTGGACGRHGPIESTAEVDGEVGAMVPTPPQVAYGFAIFWLHAPSAAILALVSLAEAVGAAVAQTASQLATATPPMAMGASLYARVYFDAGLGLHASEVSGALGKAITKAVGAQHHGRHCPIFALPVTRVLATGSSATRLAVQLYYTTVLASPPA